MNVKLFFEVIVLVLASLVIVACVGAFFYYMKKLTPILKSFVHHKKHYAKKKLKADKPLADASVTKAPPSFLKEGWVLGIDILLFCLALAVIIYIAIII